MEKELNIHREVSAFFVNNKDEILLLKCSENESDSGFWSLTDGKVNFGLTAEKAIKREIKEETILDCSKADFLFYHNSIFNKVDIEHNLTFYFKCDVDGDFEINIKSAGFQWVWLEEVEGYDLFFFNGNVYGDIWKV